MGIPLLQGRFFNEHDREGSQPVVVIDENLARHAFGRKDVVGQHIWTSAVGAAPAEIMLIEEATLKQRDAHNVQVIGSDGRAEARPAPGWGAED